ncbi:hypothetical protein B0H14DRAFT_3876836 [Mycena olivaceomarginata]|nr:hypothetical protein B0H14DRAFT_3876836 [Mycena olivaceomarginata]
MSCENEPRAAPDVGLFPTITSTIGSLSSILDWICYTVHPGQHQLNSVEECEHSEITKIAKDHGLGTVCVRVGYFARLTHCGDGSYCPAGEYCDVVDGLKGCCPDGKTCTSTYWKFRYVHHARLYSLCRRRFLLSAWTHRCYRDSANTPRCSAGGGGGGGEGSPPTTKATTTHNNYYTETTDHTPTTSNTVGTTTPHTTAPISVPTPSSGSKNVVIDVTTNSDISWDGDWVVVTSSCTSSNKAKSCSGGSDTFSSNNMLYSFTGEHRTSIYLSVASSNAQYMVTFDGEETNYGDPNSSNSTSTPGNCTFGWSRTNLSTGPHLLGIMIFGASISDTTRDFESPWSVEVQNLVVTQTRFIRWQ